MFGFRRDWLIALTLGASVVTSVACGSSGRRNNEGGSSKSGSSGTAGTSDGGDGTGGTGGTRGGSGGSGTGGADDAGAGGDAGAGAGVGGAGDAGNGGDAGAAGDSGGEGGSSGSGGTECTTGTEVGQRIVRLSFTQIATTLEALLGTTFANGIRQNHDIATATRAFPPLLGGTEGPVIAVAQFSKGDEIARAAGQYVLDNFGMVTGCATPTAACAQAFVATFAERAYRRPLASAESTSLAQVFTEAIGFGASVEQATQHGVYAVIESPYFLYRTEFGSEGTAEELRLDPYEVASLLSFFVTDGPPDAALLDAAASGGLVTPAQVAPHVARLLATPAGRRNLELALESRFGVPAFQGTDALSVAMRAETTAFFQRQLWQAPLPELVTSRIAWVNPTLADHYGVPFPSTGGSGEATLPLPRSGLLTQGLILQLNPLVGVPYRAHWVRAALLCANMEVPPNHGSQPNGIERDRAAYRARTAECAGCHTVLDPYGLPLESFDAMGRYRTVDSAGAPVDPSAVLPDELGSVAVADAAELGAAIGASDLFLACMTKNFVDWALAESPVERDDCRVAEIADSYRDGSDRSFAGLVQAILQSRLVNVRRVEP